MSTHHEQRGDHGATGLDPGFGSVFERAPVAMAQLDDEGRALVVNAAFRSLMRVQPDASPEIIDALLRPDPPTGLSGWLDEALRHPDPAPAVIAFETDRGVSIWGELHLTSVAPDGTGACQLLTVIDVTRQQQLEREVELLEDHDPVTGLLDRAAVEVQLDRLVTSKRVVEENALVLLRIAGLDSFVSSGATNPVDDALRGVAGVLSARLRTSDVVGHWGEREFIVLLTHTTLPQADHVATILAHDIHNQVLVPHGASRHQLDVTGGVVSIGSRSKLSELLRDVELLLDEADTQGGIVVGSAAPSPVIRDETFEVSSLVLLAQPIADISSGMVDRYELLVRSRDAHGALIPAGDFIPTAERLGRVGRIDRWVITETMRMIENDPRPEISYHVNISGRTLSDPHLIAFIETTIKASGIDPGRLVVEVTGSSAMFDTPFAADFSAHLATMGCRFAVDNVGRDGGDLHYLTALPFDFLKIDGSFVARCRANEADRLVIKAIVSIATGLSKTTIACGVEDPETLALLRELGVDLAQGYLVGAPTTHSALV